ncbi:hypothetical protein WJX73_003051 [Symbiochloris irregularis]|uniref:phenylalanine--tRNA ligase n=1 Tax=Symbiochloris irregularis TaxID=706552 RepID=A0AAW1P3W5_9CHLO
MPIVSVARDKLFAALGKDYSEDEFQALCFDYGIELDDVTTAEEVQRKQQHQEASASTAQEEEILYKIDIPANRYDMLCLEGIARALNIFLGRLQPVHYTVTDVTGRQLERMIVRPETALVRPFVVCAVLRGITFDQHSYKGFIDLQDKLHQNLCRQRSLVSIGTHDLSTIQGPFTYEALPPELINFVPLKQTREFDARSLMQHYMEHDLRLRRFIPIIESSHVWPVVLDANRTVLSLPPIINGAHSAMSQHTRDVFIEVTATDLTKAQTVLATLTTMFSEHCAEPFHIEPVEVVDVFGHSHVYPDLSSWPMEVSVEYINSCTGLELEAQQIAQLLSRMALSAEPNDGGATVRVEVPPTRSDVLHACDVMEDVAIAHGYNNVPKRLPPAATLGGEQPLNQLTDLLRLECAMAGFTEILTWALCSRAENWGHLLLQEDRHGAVGIGNPATAEFEVCRTSLIAGMLKTMGASKDAPLPVLGVPLGGAPCR